MTTGKSKSEEREQEPDRKGEREKEIGGWKGSNATFPQSYYCGVHEEKWFKGQVQPHELKSISPWLCFALLSRNSSDQADEGQRGGPDTWKLPSRVVTSWDSPRHPPVNTALA